MARVRRARREGVTRSEPVVEPPKGQIQLKSGGYGLVSSALSTVMTKSWLMAFGCRGWRTPEV